MTPSNFYAQQFQYYQEQLKASAQRYNLLSFARLGVFVLGILVVYWGFRIDGRLGIAMGVGSLAGFLYLVYIHDQLARKRTFQQNLSQICVQEQQALAGNTAAFDPGTSFLDSQHNFTFDLDIFGQGGLFPALARTRTQMGRQYLATALQHPSKDPVHIEQLQQVSQEISGLNGWGLEFEALGMQHPDDPKAIATLLQWVNTPTYYLTHPLYRWVIFILPAIFAASILYWGVASFWGPFPGGTYHLPVLLFLLNLGVVGINMKRVNEQHGQVSKKSRILNTYADLMAHIESQAFQSVLLKEWKAGLSTEGQPAHEVIARLGQIAYQLDQRLNMVAGVLLNGTMLWDLFWVRRLEQWRVGYRERLDFWFQILGKVDAAVSSGRWTFNHPTYSWPQLTTQPRYLHAQAIGHPLLSPETRIDNELSLGESHHFLMITGANMAGKSTFLRTVGINLILAQMGLPVCAKTFVWKPTSLMTSMRASDSLKDNESYFYAELKRLKRIIDKLKETPGVFVIVDEMLRGTNSKDKHTGSRRFIEQLIENQGMGLIATHDLELGTLATEFPDQIQNRCFEVDILEGQLHFDYTLRPGLSQKLNATFLMEQMGIM